MLAIGGVAFLGLAVGIAFWWGRPFDSFLLRRWEAELSTLPDESVPGRLEQIAALGDRSFPTLVAALHSERRIVAENASRVLRREFGKLELRSADETSPIVASVAAELVKHRDTPGAYSDTGAMWLATRILLWPIDRKLVDGELLVANCELIIRSAKWTPQSPFEKPLRENGEWQDDLIAEARNTDPAELVSTIAGGGLPVQLTDAPALPPLGVPVASELQTVAIAEPQYFTPVQSPSMFDARPMTSSPDEGQLRSKANPPVVDSRQSLDLRRELPIAPPEMTARPDLQSMSDLDVMHKLAGSDESIVRDAVDELYRRGFQTKHFRLAELLVDPDPSVRLQLIQSLPQMSGIDSRPWLLWLSRDRDPAVRKAAVSVIATSSDTTLQKRVRELEREETDEEVLQTVRQILNSRQANSIR